MERQGFVFHDIALALAGKPDSRVQIQQKRQARQEAVGRVLIQPGDFCQIQAASVALIRHAGVGIAVTQDNAAAFQVRPDHLADVLRLIADDRSTGLPALSPRPANDLRARIWVAARDAATVAFAAENALNYVVGQAEMAGRQARHTRAYRFAGGNARVRGSRVVFVAETRAEAERESEAAARMYFGQMQGRNYHKEAVDSGELPSTAGTVSEMRRQVSYHVGTPDDVAAALNEYAELLQLDRLDVMVQLPGIATEAVRRSLALLQCEVRPRLRLRAAG